MGFLDNSGDIILDAVLTDLGRKRLSEGNGSFNVTKFALGDEEINYGLWNGNHPSGSAYYDLEIIQTPVLESFTNNTSTMKSRLMSYNNNELFYLPILKLNTSSGLMGQVHNEEKVHLVAVDAATQGTVGFGGEPKSLGGAGNKSGVLFGFTPADVDHMIIVDQGIDNSLYVSNLDNEGLREAGYIVEIDKRFGKIVDPNGDVIQVTRNNETSNLAVQDDDGILSYTITADEQTDIIELSPTGPFVFDGSKGSRLKFKIQASEILSSNDSYFDRYGFSKSIAMYQGGSISMKCIDTIVRVTGVKLGNSIDIPVRFVKHPAQ